MNTKKIISLLTAVLFVAMALVSCGNTGNTETTTANASAATTASTSDAETKDPRYDDNGYLKDELPADLTYSDKEFKVFTWSNVSSWEWSEDMETTGDAIKDSIYTRQVDTEERLGIKFDIITQKGEWDNRNSFIDAVYNNVQAGSTDAYDLIGQYTPASAIGTVRGLYIDLKSTDFENYLNLDMPWWPEDIQKSGTICGKLFCVSGDATCTIIRNMVCMMVNLDIAEDMNMPDFYELVKSGEWTADEFLKYGTGVSLGLNSDGSARYTTTCDTNVKYDNLFYSGGFHFIDATDDGMALAECLTSDNLNDWYDKWANFWNQEDVGKIAINATNGFSSGSVLFNFGQISDVQNFMQDITFDFGILPYPKYSTDQESYATICGYWVTMYSIPTNANDKSMSTAVLECLGSYGYRTITPAVYEVSFKYRFLNTSQNAEVFQVLHDTLVFDIGRNLGDQINCFAAFRQAAGGSSSWTSYYDSQRRVWNSAMNKVIKAINALD